MRSLDDKIIYALNTAVPTDSFRAQTDATVKCQDLFSQIQSGHSRREVAIKKCILASAEKVKQLKDARDSDRDNVQNIKNLKSEQTRVSRSFRTLVFDLSMYCTVIVFQLRLLQSELSVEEVIKDRTQKLFNEKCRNYYKPNVS